MTAIHGAFCQLVGFFVIFILTILAEEARNLCLPIGNISCLYWKLIVIFFGTLLIFTNGLALRIYYKAQLGFSGVQIIYSISAFVCILIGGVCALTAAFYYPVI